MASGSNRATPLSRTPTGQLPTIWAINAAARVFSAAALRGSAQNTPPHFAFDATKLSTKHRTKKGAHPRAAGGGPQGVGRGARGARGPQSERRGQPQPSQPRPGEAHM